MRTVLNLTLITRQRVVIRRIRIENQLVPAKVSIVATNQVGKFSPRWPKVGINHWRYTVTMTSET